jgi:hypothetical protein
MFASMVICDDTYSNKFWLIVGLGMFALGEVNHMEREMCSYLEWRLKIEPSKLKEFESKVRKDVRSPGTYLNYVLPSPAPFAHALNNSIWRGRPSTPALVCFR